MKEIKRCRLLTKEEVAEKLKNTPRIDVQKLVKEGYVEAKEYHQKLGNGR